MRNLLTVISAFISLQCSAQFATSTLPPLDKSPMDISYYPVNYPILKIQGKITDPLGVRLIYSRPQLNGRRAFGELRELGKLWRLGANEATEIEFYRNIKLAGKVVKKGRYTLYAIPNAGQWTIILNRDIDTWGDFKYDESKDVLRTNVFVAKNEITEVLTMIFEKSTSGANLLIYWDDEKVTLPIVF
ncbi:MAG: DUF2911 domain-containing protein [Ginsengibacter sp.]